MCKTPPRRTLVAPSAEENRKIVSAAKADPDAKPLTKAQMKAMVPLKAVPGHDDATAA